ncbi:MAG: hypothetical protein U9Q71_05595, partial [Pseudomonadota bacterium]|nr:hypothetical protein [Pseudomonadota bacterium]
MGGAHRRYFSNNGIILPLYRGLGCRTVIFDRWDAVMGMTFRLMILLAALAGGSKVFAQGW